MVIPYAVAADLFRGARLTSVSGLLGIAWGLAPVLAPAVDGFLVQYVSSRFVFAAMAMLAGLVVLVLLRLPETLAAENRVPFPRILRGSLWRCVAAAIKAARERITRRVCQTAAGLP
jgi:DHA1 family bicyclomycin/chloramphenicol resistance-like MFS transporter